jgi:hypothetical protein
MNDGTGSGLVSLRTLTDQIATKRIELRALVTAFRERMRTDGIDQKLQPGSVQRSVGSH